MRKNPEELAIFQKLISEKLGINFVARKANPYFLIDIEAYLREATENKKLFPAIRECLSALEFELDENSIRRDGEFTWFIMKNKEEEFAISVSNPVIEPFHIIITIMRFGLIIEKLHLIKEWFVDEKR